MLKLKATIQYCWWWNKGSLVVSVIKWYSSSRWQRTVDYTSNQYWSIHHSSQSFLNMQQHVKRRNTPPLNLKLHVRCGWVCVFTACVCVYMCWRKCLAQMCVCVCVCVCVWTWLTIRVRQTAYGHRRCVCAYTCWSQIVSGNYMSTALRWWRGTSGETERKRERKKEVEEDDKRNEQQSVTSHLFISSGTLRLFLSLPPSLSSLQHEGMLCVPVPDGHVNAHCNVCGKLKALNPPTVKATTCDTCSPMTFKAQ